MSHFHTMWFEDQSPMAGTSLKETHSIFFCFFLFQLRNYQDQGKRIPDIPLALQPNPLSPGPYTIYWISPLWASIVRTPNIPSQHIHCL